MLTALVLLALGDAPHAALHPAQADLYFEVADVGAVISAYSTAPAVRVVSSAGAARIAAVVKAVGFDLESLAGSLMPVPDPTRPADRWWPWSHATRASCSLSGIEGGVSTGGGPRSLSGWLICDFALPEAASQAEQALIAMGGGESRPVGEIALAEGSIPVREIGSPIEALDPHAWLVREGDRLILGFGAARPEEYVARSTDPQGGLAPAWARNTTANSPTPAGTVPVLDILADMEELPAFAADNPAFAATTLLLAPFLSSKGYWRITLRADRFLTDALYEPRGRAREILGLLGPAPAPSSAARLVPPEAVGAWIGAVDPARAESAVGTLLMGLLGESPVEGPREGEAGIADGLKSSVAVSLLPVESLVKPTPRVLLSIDLADAAQFQAGLDAWLTRAQAGHPDLEVERKPYRKVPTIVLGSKQEKSASSAPTSPFGASALEPKRVTIVVLDDRVLVASTPSLARSEIKRLQEKSETTTQIGIQGIAHPAEAIEYSTLDWATLLSSVYDGARGFAPMLAQNLEKPIEVDKLPTGAQLFAPLQPSTSWSRIVDGRIQTHGESSFGPETPAAIAAVIWIGMKAMRMPRATPVDVNPTPTNADETPASADASDERVRTLTALREVRTAIAVYRSQFGRLPDTTTDLLQKTDAFPDGFLKSGAVPKDAWNRDLVYVRAADGSTYTLYSFGADGIDQQGSGDDVRLP
jgi:hypothetical protein